MFTSNVSRNVIQNTVYSECVKHFMHPIPYLTSFYWNNCTILISFINAFI